MEEFQHSVRQKLAEKEITFDYDEVERRALPENEAVIVTAFTFSDGVRDREGVLNLYYAFEDQIWRRQNERYEVIEKSVVYARIIIPLVDELTSESVAGATAIMRRVDNERLSSPVSISSDNGQAILTVLNGRYELVVNHPDYSQSVTGPYSIPPGDSIFENPIRLLRRKTTPDRINIEFQVQDLDNRPVEGVNITLIITSNEEVIEPGTITTGPNGVATARLLPGEQYMAVGQLGAGSTSPLLVEPKAGDVGQVYEMTFLNHSPTIKWRFRKGSNLVRPGERIEIDFSTGG